MNIKRSASQLSKVRCCATSFPLYVADLANKSGIARLLHIILGKICSATQALRKILLILFDCLQQREVCSSLL